MNTLSTYITIAASSAIVLFTPVGVLAADTMSGTTATTMQEKSMPATSGAQSMEVTATTKIDYELPYPGLLPDSPLYFVKQVRDWILDKLVVDPIKKAEFYILQADKRLVMGTMLDDHGKAILGEQVISKAEKYMNSAVQSLLALKSKGLEVPASIVDHLTKALQRHEQVLMAEVAKAQDAQKAGLTASLTLVQQLLADLSKLK